jgi:hypothetical protein
MSDRERFLEYLDLIRNGNLNKNKLREDEEISRNLKSIILAWSSLQRSDFDEVYELSSACLNDPNSEIDLLAHLVSGVAYNNAGEYRKAVVALLRAEQIHKAQKEYNQRLAELIEDNLLITYLNMNEIHPYLERLDWLSEAQSKKRFNYFEILYLAHVGETTKAGQILKKFLQEDNELEEPKKTLLYIIQFEISFKNQDKAGVDWALQQMSKLKKYSYSDNFKFMKLLSDFYLHSKPLYLYPTDFTRNKFLRDQVIILKALDEQDLRKAESVWKECSLNYSSMFGEPYQWVGSPCLFSMVLARLMDKQVSPPLELAGENSSKELLVLKIFSEHEKIQKSTLYFLLYKQEIPDEKDLSKLSRLIGRVREKYGLNIKTSKGFYLIKDRKTA